MTPLKAESWKRATKNEFYKFIDELASIYASNVYRAKLSRDEDVTEYKDIYKDKTLLFKDYKQWLLDKERK